MLWGWLLSAAMAGSWSSDRAIYKPGRSDEALYNRTREWMVKAFVASDSALEVERPNTLLMGKVVIPFEPTSPNWTVRTQGYIRCVFRIDVKPGAVRVEMEQCSHRSTLRDGGWGPITTDEHPSQVACDAMGGLGGCRSKFYRRTHAEMTAKVGREFRLMVESLTVALDEDPPRGW